MQNYEYYVPPGGKEFETIGEADFIFVRFADREFDLVIDNETVTMEKGAEYTHDRGRFHRFEIHNPDPENPVLIRLAIGTARYRSRIISGDVTVTPGVRKADGRVVDDTRRAVNLTLYPKPGFTPTAISRGDFLASNSRVGGSENDYPGYDVIGSVQQKAAASNHNGQTVVTFVTLNNPARISFLKLNSPSDGSGTLIPVNFYEGGTHPTTVGLLNNGTILFSLGGNPGGGGSANEPDDYNLFSVSSSGGTPQVVHTPDFRDKFTSGIFEYGENIYVPYQNEVSGDRGFYVLSKGFSRVRKVTVSDSADRRYTSDGKTIYSLRLVSGYPIAICDPETLEPVESFGTSWNGNVASITMHQGRLVIWESGTTGTWDNKVYSLTDYQKTAAFYVGLATGGCPNISRQPTIYDTGANLDITTNDDGNQVLTGEVVRAVLDSLAAEQQVTEDYRDHVYGLSVRGQPLAGFDVAGSTMQAAKIDDQFTVTLPASITVTVDNGLTYEGY